MNHDECMKRYRELAHAVQTGIKALHETGDLHVYYPKHLRTGLNVAMSDHGSLAKLLIDKGLITEDEYYNALIEGLEREKASLEKELSQILGQNVQLH